MTIVKRLYTGVMPDKTASRLIKRIKKRKPCADVYVITLPLFEDGLLEVYEANEFLQPYYKKRTDDIVIVGMSMTKAGAFFLIRILSGMYTVRPESLIVRTIFYMT